MKNSEKSTSIGGRCPPPVYLFDTFINFMTFMLKGHPRVWINLDDGEIHECMYCGLRYQKQAAYEAALALAAKDES